MKDWKKDPDYLRLSPKMQKAVKHLVTMKDKKMQSFVLKVLEAQEMVLFYEEVMQYVNERKAARL